MCRRVNHVEPANSYNWDFEIEKQSNNNRSWLQNKQPKTLFISVRGGKQDHGWMAASETIFLLISVHQSVLLVLTCPHPSCPPQKWSNPFQRTLGLHYCFRKNWFFSKCVESKLSIFQDPLFCQTQINLYSDVPAFLVYANNEIFIKFAYVWP